jgi:rhodanese-related sulfurtransferase
MECAQREPMAFVPPAGMLAASLLVALLGCGTSAKSPVDALVAAPDSRPAADSATAAGGPDAGLVGSDAVGTDSATAAGGPEAGLVGGDAVGPDTATLRADVLANDTVPVLADAEARDIAPARADAGAMETAPVRADVPGPEVAVIRADALVPDAESPRPDVAPFDDASPRSDTGGPEAAVPGGDAASSGCKLDGGAAAFVHMTPLELKTLLDGSEDPFLINVKGTSIGQISGTDAVLVNDIPGIEARVGGDLCADIILYCQSGGTSQSVGTQLIAKGYVHVRDLAGGITAWKAAGYPTQ